MQFQFREYIESFLKVDVDFGQDQSTDAKCVAILRFVVTNTAPANEYQADIVYEEVQLKVGIPPKWHIEKVEDLAGGQSFTYEHCCTTRDITKLQWAVDGRISPKALLHFHRRPVNVTGNQQLSVKAYFDYIASINEFQWLKEKLQGMTAPGSDISQAEIQAREAEMGAIIFEISDASQRIHDFLAYLDSEKYGGDIVKHQNRVREYLNKTANELVTLMQIVKSHKFDSFNKTRDDIIFRIIEREDKLDKATRVLAKRVGVLKTNKEAKL